MPPPNILTDPLALQSRRRRATEAGDFLHRLAIDEIEDRLGSVNKSFTAPAVVTGWPEIWRDVLPTARIVPDDETLQLQVGQHDLLIHVMSLHWANDPVGQLIQSRRALRPDGLFLGVCYAGQTLNELRRCLGEAEAAVSGGLSPRVAPMADLRDWGGLLQRAGLALPVADSVTTRVEYDDLHALMRDLRAMGETNALAARLRRPTRRAVMDRAAELYAAHFPGQHKAITATFEMVFLAGWAPDATQPKPLRPGSAQQRLADALGTQEKPLSD